MRTKYTCITLAVAFSMCIAHDSEGNFRQRRMSRRLAKCCAIVPCPCPIVTSCVCPKYPYDFTDGSHTLYYAVTCPSTACSLMGPNNLHNTNCSSTCTSDCVSVFDVNRKDSDNCYVHPKLRGGTVPPYHADSPMLENGAILKNSTVIMFTLDKSPRFAIAKTIYVDPKNAPAAIRNSFGDATPITVTVGHEINPPTEGTPESGIDQGPVETSEIRNVLVNGTTYTIILRK